MGRKLSLLTTGAAVVTALTAADLIYHKVQLDTCDGDYMNSDYVCEDKHKMYIGACGALTISVMTFCISAAYEWWSNPSVDSNGVLGDVNHYE